MSREMKKSFFEWISQYWVVITALTTLVISAIGLISSSYYYSVYNVDYLELAEFNDFVRHAIARPYFSIILLIVFFTISLQMYVIYEYDKSLSSVQNFYRDQKFVKRVRVRIKYHVKLFVLLLVKSFVIVFLGLLFVLYPLGLEYRNIKYKDSNRYNVETDTGSIKCVSYVGRINVNHVFWSHKLNAAIIIPSSSLKRLEFFISFEDAPVQFKADNHIINNEYVQWLDNVKKKCGEEF